MKPVYYLVLAAGVSSRFGRNKLVEVVMGRPVVARVVEAGLKAGLRDVVVVTGHFRQETMEALKGLTFTEVYNPEYMGGMSTSVRAGVRFIHGQAQAAVVMPGDMAFMEAEVIRPVLEAYMRSKKPVTVATYGGRSGHPIIFDEAIFHELLSIDEQGRGMKAVVERHRNEVERVEVGTPRALLDIDVPQDIERAKVELGLA